MQEALQRMLAVHPRLRRVQSAGAALGLPAGQLLHAGPPLADPRHPPPVLLSSAVMAILHEGWARSEAQAEAMVRSGELVLAPAQPRGCVTPLACVVSSGMPLFEVEAGGRALYAPVSTVRGPDTRMGSRDLALLDRLQARDARVVPAWQRALTLGGPLDLLPLAGHGLARGDDLHSRTASANALLALWLRACDEQEAAAEVEATPLFFLTLWMAASAQILRAAEGADLPTLVTRAGGNGERFGVALAARPDHWTCVEAAPPQGRRLAGPPDAPGCPAIGDSAVIDLLGCGGLALHSAPEPLEAFAQVLPDDHAGLAQRLLAAPHPVLGRRIAVDARRVVEEGATPLIALAMLADDGRSGFIGRGLYRPPLALFERALQEAGLS